MFGLLWQGDTAALGGFGFRSQFLSWSCLLLSPVLAAPCRSARAVAEGRPCRGLPPLVLRGEINSPRHDSVQKPQERYILPLALLSLGDAGARTRLSHMQMNAAPTGPGLAMPYGRERVTSQALR